MAKLTHNERMLFLNNVKELVKADTTLISDISVAMNLGVTAAFEEMRDRAYDMETALMLSLHRATGSNNKKESIAKIVSKHATRFNFEGVLPTYKD